MVLADIVSYFTAVNEEKQNVPLRSAVSIDSNCVVDKLASKTENISSTNKLYIGQNTGMEHSRYEISFRF